VLQELANPGAVQVYGKETKVNLSVAPPEKYLVVPDDTMVFRAFGFVDLCSFSAFTAEAGPPAAFEALRQFRSLVRVVASTRGVRIANWLGDGAMLVGVDAAAVAATIVELVARSSRNVRGSVTQGHVLLFEGDDLIGAPVNLASRLCSAARPNQVLTTESVEGILPDWILRRDLGKIELRGLKDESVYELFIDPLEADSLHPVFNTGQVPAVSAEIPNTLQAEQNK
jgi:adenylate cyclase